MKIVAATGAVLFTLCGPALADPSAPAPRKVHFALRDTARTPHTFDVTVGERTPCATASEKVPDHQIELRACVSGRAQLDIEWSSRSAWGEYRSTSSLPFVPGATVELGSANGPHLGVTVQ
jgi:hypothetical protein